MHYLRSLQLAREGLLRSPDGGEGGSSSPAVTPPAASEPQTFSVDYVRELRAENKGYRVKAAEMERAAHEAKTAAEKATADMVALTKKAEIDIAARVAEVSTAASQRLVRAEIKAGAVAAGLAHLDFLKLIDTSKVTVGEDGEVVVPETFWSDAKKAFPHLFGATGADRGTTTNPNSPPKPSVTGAKKAADMTPAEYKAARARIAKGIVD